LQQWFYSGYALAWRTGIFVTQTTWQNYSRQERQKRTLWGAQEAAPNNVAARSVANPT
jgi:hypothetical protein